MKKKDIYEVTIKIIGTIAVCKFIESIIACLIIYITFHSISTNIKFDFTGISQTDFSIFTICSIALYGLFGYLFLFMTDKILQLFRLTDYTEVTSHIEKKTIYHIVVLFIGFFMFTYSGNQLISNTFSKTEGNTIQQTYQQPTISQTATAGTVSTIISTSSSPATTTSITINYINILIFLLSILILIKSEKLSRILMPKENEELID
jgi:hypothetical protein